jgi:tRNA G18 (ribose-2'-O)-methylase SpoU
MAQGDVTAPGSGAIEGQRQRLQLVDSLNVSVATGILLHHMMASAKQQ